MIEKYINVQSPKFDKLHCFKFESLNEFKDFLTNNLTSQQICNANWFYEYKKRFYCNSVEECFEYIEKGYPNKAKTLAKTVKMTSKAFQQGSQPRIEHDNYYYGSRPNIQNTLIGLPKTMVRQRKQPKPKKILNVLIDTAVSWTITKKEYEYFFNNALAYVYRLALKGYSIRLSLLNCFSLGHRNTLPTIVVNLKHESQPFNLTRLSYPSVGLSFFRMLSYCCFYAHYLKTKYPEEVCSVGGEPLYANHNNQARLDILNAISEPNTTMIYVNYNSDLERTFNIWTF